MQVTLNSEELTKAIEEYVRNRIMPHNPIDVVVDDVSDYQAYVTVNPKADVPVAPAMQQVVPARSNSQLNTQY